MTLSAILCGDWVNWAYLEVLWYDLTGLRDPAPSSGLAGGDAGDGVQDDVCRGGIKPQAASTSCPGAAGLPDSLLHHHQVDLI